MYYENKEVTIGNKVIKTSINIEEKLLENFKIYCIKNKISMTEKLNELIRGVLNEREKR